MDCSMPGFLVHHQLPELTQIHVHWVGDAIQPSHLLSAPSPPAFNLSQHEGLFQWVSSLHQVAKYWPQITNEPQVTLSWLPDISMVHSQVCEETSTQKNKLNHSSLFIFYKSTTNSFCYGPALGLKDVFRVPGKDWGQEEKGATEDKIIGWHHQLNGHEFEQAPGDSGGRESVVCFSPWNCRVGHDLATDNNRLL